MKIKLDKSAIESLPVHDNTILLVARLIRAIEKLYGLDAEFFMFEVLRKFSETYGKDKSKESQFCYEHLLYVLNELYPKEFQKEILK